MKTISPNISYYLAALYLRGIGPVRLHHWIEKFGEIKNLFTASESELKECRLTSPQITEIKNPNWSQVEKDLKLCEKLNCHLISFHDEKYPVLLREISSAPLILFVLGDVDLLSQSQLAVVGSRNPTPGGKESAELFSYYLAEAGLVITSGLALGIDGASHRGALNAKGKTIAVCGSGLQHIYPASHRKLAAEIIENGALVSEFPPSITPKAKFFPRRNRLISGLSLGVLVIEAALRSGSLITARFASEQGREVFAIPGSIHNPLARGCHQLIRQGAKLVETATDILEELGALKAVITAEPKKNLKIDDKYMKFLTKIGYETLSLDAIIALSGLTTAEVSSMLLILELKGYVKSVQGGYVRNGFS